jgi:4-amino-4-deoxychorismate lyase
LEQVIARSEWQDNNITEGIMLDTKNNIIEAVFSNIFIVKSGELLTPDLSEAGVAGVMRRFIIEELAPQLKIKTQIANITMSDLLNAEEIFLCNSLYGIWPIRTLFAEKEHTFNVKSDSATIALQQALEKGWETFKQL